MSKFPLYTKIIDIKMFNIYYVMKSDDCHILDFIGFSI